MANRQIAIQVLPKAAREALERIAADSIEASVKVDAIVEAEADRLLRRVKDAWPVDTGFSLAQWQLFRTGKRALVIMNRARYAGWVFRAGDDSKTPLEQTLVRVEVETTRKRILEQARAVVATPGLLDISGILASVRGVLGFGQAARSAVASVFRTAPKGSALRSLFYREG